MIDQSKGPTVAHFSQKNTLTCFCKDAASDYGQGHRSVFFLNKKRGGWAALLSRFSLQQSATASFPRASFLAENHDDLLRRGCASACHATSTTIISCLVGPVFAKVERSGHMLAVRQVCNDLQAEVTRTSFAALCQIPYHPAARRGPDMGTGRCRDGWWLCLVSTTRTARSEQLAKTRVHEQRIMHRIPC